ncbi:MAG: trypsin-like peptidase domain-containing protein [Verrucomicrobiales bacterium]|jgi:S1-C subfamily serine protease|nr:trypsin-like peptidase domain-containing protein [Verrucomicrobiales bacterium]
MRKLRFFVSVALLAGASNLPAQNLAPDQEPIVQVVKKVRPAVVNIYTETMEQRLAQTPQDLYFQRFFGNAYVSRGRIVQVPIRSLGSGAIVSPAGYIVTNEHVIGNAGSGSIKVTLADNESYTARLVRADRDLDLALIKISPKQPLAAISLTGLSPNLLGQTVIAIGNPVGFESSVSQGILSATNRTLTVGDTSYDSLLQTDAAINPGNSGGPLVDIAGQFVGLSTAKEANAGVEGIGFAIPAERVAAFVTQAINIAEGRQPEPPPADLALVLRQKFGLQVREMDQRLAESFGYPRDSGLLVELVDGQSPADRAGIQQGMLLRSVGQRHVRALADLPRELQRLKPGDPLAMTLSFYRQYGARNVLTTATAQLKAK